MKHLMKHLMKHTTLFAFIFAGLAACDASPSAPTSHEPTISGPSFEKVLKERFDDVPFALFNPCPPAEWVDGTIDFRSVETGEPGDTKRHVNWSAGHGVGRTSGDRYKLRNNLKPEFETSGPNIDVGFQQSLWIKRQGTKDIYDAFIVARFTSEPPTLEITESRVECGS
jgi:hypothetical protein